MITPLRRESQSSTSSENQETAAAVATLQVVSAASLQPVSHTETVIATVNSSPAPSPSPPASPRLPSILEAAIKAEPKVEVERLPSPTGGSSDDLMPQARYINFLKRFFIRYVNFYVHLYMHPRPSADWNENP